MDIWWSVAVCRPMFVIVNSTLSWLGFDWTWIILKVKQPNDNFNLQVIPRHEPLSLVIK